MNRMRRFLNNLEIKRAYKLARKSVDMHMVSPTIAEFEYEIRDVQTGKVEEKGKQLTHSYTRNFHNFICLNGFAYPHNHSLIGASHGVGTLVLQNTSGVDFGSTSNDTVCWTTAGDGLSGRVLTGGAGFTNTGTSTDYGIVAGSDGTAESLDDVAMTTLITHGTGAGQLSHSSMVTDAIDYNSTTKTWSVIYSRLLNNLSGGDVTVREIGMIGRMSNTTTTYNVLAIRDVPTTAITVANNKNIKIIYKFSYVMP